jgi:SAM-dependent methyltransferase
MKSWLEKKQYERGKRALERQLEYQERKAESLRGDATGIVLNIIKRAEIVRKKLESVKKLDKNVRVIEVGSGAHGLIFGFGAKGGVGVDPLAVEYKQLFPKWQGNAQTVSAIGEELPFADASFDIVLCDNVIDHAEKPLKIADELIRILKPEGLLYFTVNVHHPFYHLASKAHGVWNALGIKFEISPFADHTVHLTDNKMREFFIRKPLEIISMNSSVNATKATLKQIKAPSVEQRLKRIFFKNALFELIAVKK